MNATVSNDRVGIAVILDAANGAGYVDPEVSLMEQFCFFFGCHRQILKADICKAYSRLLILYVSFVR